MFRALPKRQFRNVRKEQPGAGWPGWKVAIATLSGSIWNVVRKHLDMFGAWPKRQFRNVRKEQPRAGWPGLRLEGSHCDPVRKHLECSVLGPNSSFERSERNSQAQAGLA